MASTVKLVDGTDDLPRGFEISQHQWVDLDDEGISGLLAQRGCT